MPGLDGPALVVGPVFVCFEFAGPPRHKARPGARIIYPRGADPYVQFYPDPATQTYEESLKWVAKAAMRGKLPSTRALAILMHVFKPIPPSWTDAEYNAAICGAILPSGKPDADNYLKIIDALNGVVWEDDAQVVDARVIKLFSDEPALRIEVREMIVNQAPSAAQGEPVAQAR